MVSLPPVAPFPKASWLQHMSATDWDALVEAWTALSQAYLGLSDDEFRRATTNDESVANFVVTYVSETAASQTSTSTALLKPGFQLTSRLLTLTRPPQLLEHHFLSGFAKVYPKKRAAPLLSQLFTNHAAAIESSLAALKKLLIPHLDAGIKGDLNLVESHLIALSPLLHASPHACILFLAGSDFFDGLVTCFRVMNPPLRKVIITTTYLCLVGLAEAEPPKWAMLSDELFTLKTAADAHQQGPLNVNDSLVAELVTATPLLRVLSRRAEVSEAATDSLKKRITALEPFKKGAMVRPKRLTRRKVDKGKGNQTREDVHVEMHIHRMSQITQVQDLFPDLGAGFVSKCLDEYDDDIEQVVANLLAETLPSRLAAAHRGEPLSSHNEMPPRPDLAPRPTPPLVPTRRNVFDDDDFDHLAADASKISFGKKPAKTADEMLQDKSTAPNKAAILSALANFDSDDDERDDTYDAADVGGTVDSANQEADGANDGNEEALFRAYHMDARVFDRDAATRRGAARTKLREETGMTDEAMEGWAVMLTRNPQQKKRLEAKYAFSGQQAQIERTAWRASPAGSGAEESDPDAGGSRSGRGGHGGRGAPRGRGRGRGGNVAGPTGERETEAARKNKEAHKGSRANHNRRDARAKKMSRGGFPG
ncbi:Activating signal cointegrator 1 complex subunit 2 [Tolypocladium ophioglossoides CBS 100239]|uniref:Activating signal cointegrator 1 complex subunit 2 n=1 Tax=Tolypocladium ophioglossoides (strain CBS 100239) TaxID=1163406 RepID=A0A0L0N5G8_TOLOC|nr:Activating signal cointegrator 1 complex subunit 2 [Tolypocladium ophioglossoides CBS 100239]